MIKIDNKGTIYCDEPCGIFAVCYIYQENLPSELCDTCPFTLALTRYEETIRDVR